MFLTGRVFSERRLRIGQFIGAAFDGCTSCQDTHLNPMVEDAATTARLVELGVGRHPQPPGGVAG